MADFQFPELEQFLASQTPARAPYPVPAIPALPQAPQRNLFAAGLGAGIDELQGLGGAAASAVGQAIGLEGLQRWGAGVAARNQQEAQAAGRPDLEIAPWKEGGASVLPWLAYQATKQIPQIVPTVAAGMVAAPVIGPALAGTAAARLGAAVPQILGGGGLRAGADFAARRAGLEAGERLAGAAAGAAAASYPTSVGSLYQEALERDQAGGGAATKGDAFKALALGVPYGALEGIQPAGIARALQEGLKGGILSRTGKAAAAGALTEAPTEATQTILENTFRPDLSAAQKAERIVDAALTGAAVGGVFGSVGGIRRAKVSGLDASNAEMKAKVDEAVAPPASPAPAPEVSRFAELDDATLAANRARLEERAFRGEESTALTRELAAYRGEEAQREFARSAAQPSQEALAAPQTIQDQLARREAQLARVPEQELLFGEQDLTQPAVAPLPSVAAIPERVAPVTEMQTRARDLLLEGTNRKELNKTEQAFVDNITAADEQELAVTLTREAARGPNTPAFRLADKLGLTESDAKVKENLAAANTALQDAQIAATAGQADPAVLEQAQARVDKITAQKARRDAVLLSLAEQQAPSAATPPSQQTGPTSQQLAARFVAPAPAPVTEAQGELPLTMGRQTAEPQASPQTFEQSSAFLKNAVGTTSNAQIEEIGRATIPDAVARISTIIGNKKPKGAVLTRMGRYFGLVDERNNPVDIPTAISNTERAITTLQQQYDVLPQFSPARQADVRRNLDNQSTVLTERLDALRAAQQTQAIDRTIYDRTTPPEVQAQGRAARAQVTGQFPQPTIESQLRNLPFPEPVQPTAAPRGEPVEPISVVPTARPAPAAEAVQVAQTGAVPPPASTPSDADIPVEVPPSTSVEDTERVTTDTTNVITKGANTLLNNVGEAIGGRRQLRDTTVRAALGWSSVRQMARVFDKFFNGAISRLQDVQNLRRSISNALASLSNADTGELLIVQQNKEMNDRYQEAVNLTVVGVDPTKTWAEQPGLHKEPNAEELRKLVTRGNELVQWMKRKPLDPKASQGDRRTVYSVFEREAAGGAWERYSRMTEMLQITAAGNEKIRDLPGLQRTTLQRFLDDETLRTDSLAARDYFKREFETTLAAAKKAVAADKSLTDLATQVKQSEELAQRTERVPYFPLGRYGNYYVAMDVTAGANGEPDPKTLQRVADALGEAGIEDVVIPVTAKTNKVFIRVESLDARAALKQAADALASKGLVSDVKIGERSEETAATGNASEAATALVRAVEAQLRKSLAGIKNPEERARTEKTQVALIASLNRAALDMEPDNSIKRVLVKRKGISGFSSDLARNYSTRMNTGINALANMATIPGINKALSDVDAVVRAQTDPDQRASLVRVRDELNRRISDDVAFYGKSAYDTMASVSYAMLMSSPASAVLQLGSLGTMTLPRLASMKDVGFVKAAKAMADATGPAFQIMRAVIAHSFKDGYRRGADIAFTPESIAGAKISPELKKFVARVAGANLVELGAPAREMGRLSSSEFDTKTDTVLRYATFMTTYTETISRLITAISVYNLRGGAPDALSMARTTIDDTLLNYDSTNTARQIGRAGLIGRPSRVVFQFASYQLMMLETLGTEFARAANLMAATPEERSQARRFFAYHSAGVAVLAGALGLPLFSAAARFYELVAEALSGDDEPVDLETDIRNFLTDTFGEGMGEVLARGLPRALGIDISQRAGEQDLLPFSRFLTDRRKLEDRFEDLAMDILGAPTSVATGFILGARDIAEGKWQQGLKQMVPGALKGPLEAGYMLSEGSYFNARGQRLPITPTAADIFTRAIGFTPATKATYDEARLATLTRQSLLTQQASSIRQDAIKAFQSQDANGFRDALARAQEFDRNNPSYAISPTLGSALTTAETNLAKARATGTTLGTRMTDIEGVRAQRFARGIFD